MTPDEHGVQAETTRRLLLDQVIARLQHERDKALATITAQAEQIADLKTDNARLQKALTNTRDNCLADAVLQETSK